MGTREVDCLILVCDGCGKDLEDDDHKPHFDNAGDAREMSADHEWRTYADQDWCPACVNLSHDCTSTVEYSECARCGEPLDDDDDAPAVSP